MGEGTEYLIENFEELIESYLETENTDLPATLKSAVEQEWELSLDVLTINTALAYDAEQRKKDKTKLVRLEDVLKTLSRMEEAVVRDNVVTPKHLLKNMTVGLKEEVQNLIAALFDLVVNLWNNRQWLGLGWRLVKRFWERFFVLAAVAELAALVDDGMKSRDSWAGSIRKKALFQNTNAKRYRRRKITRK